MLTCSVRVLLGVLFVSLPVLLTAQEAPKLSVADRKLVNEWMSERAQKKIEAHKLDVELKQAWTDEMFTSPEIDALRKKYRELQQELIRTRTALQKKVLDVPAVAEKRRQLEAANQRVETLTKKVTEKGVPLR